MAPDAYSIFKKTVERMVEQSENAEEAATFIMIDDLLNRSIASGVNYLTQDYLKNHPQLNNMLNHPLTKKAIAVAQNTIMSRVSGTIRNQI